MGRCRRKRAWGRGRVAATLALGVVLVVGPVLVASLAAWVGMVQLAVLVAWDVAVVSLLAMVTVRGLRRRPMDSAGGAPGRGLGGTSVREPRRPLPSAGSASLHLELPVH